MLKASRLVYEWQISGVQVPKKQKKVSQPLDVITTVQALPWLSEDQAGHVLAKRACQMHEEQISCWDLNTAI